MKRQINFDAFSSGQIESKLWLCEKIENLPIRKAASIYIFGGWYGMTAFLILSRGRLEVEKIRSFDLSLEACEVADLVNENWVWQEWKFKAIQKDISEIDYFEKPDLIINTSTEHTTDLSWWNNLPKGTFVALQGTNMEHEEHVLRLNSLEEFQEKFRFREEIFSGETTFTYPNKSFKRFMLIGAK